MGGQMAHLSALLYSMCRAQRTSPSFDLSYYYYTQVQFVFHPEVASKTCCNKRPFNDGTIYRFSASATCTFPTSKVLDIFVLAVEGDISVPVHRVEAFRG